MHKNKYCFDIHCPIAMSSAEKSSTTPSPVPTEDPATRPDAMEEDGESDKDEDTVVVAAPEEETSDLKLSNISEENPDLANYLSKLDKRIATNLMISSRTHRQVTQVRSTQLGVSTRIRRLERDGVKG